MLEAFHLNKVWISLGWFTKLQDALKNYEKKFNYSVPTDFHCKFYTANPCLFYTNLTNTDSKKGKNALFPHPYEIKSIRFWYISNQNFLKIYYLIILNTVFPWATHCSDIHFFSLINGL